MLKWIALVSISLVINLELQAQVAATPASYLEIPKKKTKISNLYLRLRKNCPDNTAPELKTLCDAAKNNSALRLEDIEEYHKITSTTEYSSTSFSAMAIKDFGDRLTDKARATVEEYARSLIITNLCNQNLRDFFPKLCTLIAKIDITRESLELIAIQIREQARYDLTRLPGKLIRNQINNPKLAQDPLAIRQRIMKAVLFAVIESIYDGRPPYEVLNNLYALDLTPCNSTCNQEIKGFKTSAAILRALFSQDSFSEVSEADFNYLKIAIVVEAMRFMPDDSLNDILSRAEMLRSHIRSLQAIKLPELRELQASECTKDLVPCISPYIIVFRVFWEESIPSEKEYKDFLLIADGILKNDWTNGYFAHLLSLDQNLDSKLRQSIALIVSIAEIKESKEFNAVLDQYLMAATSYKDKYNKPHIMLNAFVGANFGSEVSDIKNLETGKPMAGLYLPIGFHFSVPVKAVHLGLFLPLMDLGALSSVRFGDKDNKPQSTTIGFTQLLSPGAYMVIGLARSPFALGFGLSVNPNLREIEGQATSMYRFNVFLAVDVPLY